jgi:hypothetical protein
MQRFEVSDEDWSGNARLDHAVVMLPLQVRGDIGIYSADATDVIKELTADGVDAAYLHDRQHRQWRILKGDVPYDLAIGFAGSLMATATWVALANVLRRLFQPGRQMRARVLKQQQRPDGSVDSTWFAFEGDAETFVGALTTLTEQGGKDV